MSSQTIPLYRSAFGILEWGACGYTNGDGEIMTAKEEAAAYSDDNPDYAGSCGRCYEVLFCMCTLEPAFLGVLLCWCIRA